MGLLAGVIVVVAGVRRLGRAVTYIPWPVIEGFTLGIAIIIFLQQVPAALGTEPRPSTNALVAAIESLPTVSWPEAAWALGIVLVVAAVMVFAPRIHKLLPGSIIAIVLVCVVAVAQLPVATIGELPPGLPMPIVPERTFDTMSPLIGAAFTVAALAAIESLLSARVAASISDTGPYDADRELVGQGTRVGGIRLLRGHCPPRGRSPAPP
ncbi:SulP family inorganic anion transporter [Agromyces bauzanensis]|uniref:SLC26A/SulP transporter domain-containing protein n=1 Tax=Agromyces bauzanensis TaxID=1308924 RepID=A0A917PSV2_9MICO|nr:SulP family inorganic anion transporter [Agromyces bauzanensis]GGJ90878.1 hypothetical protein GCM10011372_31700 [Agromyces bauzanensis]